MRKNQKAGRNDLCPCGSGKKFKKCCVAKHQRRNRMTIAYAVLIGTALIGALAFGAVSMGEDASSTPMAGKVWSPEHGHWH